MKEFLIQHGAFIFWAAVAVVSLVVEAMTAELVSCWFAPSAIVSMILSTFVDLFWVQLLVFLVLSAILLAVVRRYVKKRLGIKDTNQIIKWISRDSISISDTRN